jgi:hypothetical protein
VKREDLLDDMCPLGALVGVTGPEDFTLAVDGLSGDYERKEVTLGGR